MKTLLTILFLSFAINAQAQCVAEVKDIVQNQDRGSIVAQTEYVLNGVVVQQGETRYLETSGTNEEIIAKVKDNIEEHCENLIKRMPTNQRFIDDVKLRDAAEEESIEVDGKTFEEVLSEYMVIINKRNSDNLIAQKERTQPIIDAIKGDLVGVKTKNITEAEETFKSKKIKVTYDSKNTISDIIVE